jgi:anti-sigma regulatory factor (Ser/Thr protein kinase)
MPTELKLTFPATTSGLIAALEAVEHTGATWNINADLVSRARIVVEELFSNTIKYGYGEECGRPVRLYLHAEPAFTLTYEDEASPFDTTGWRPNGDDDISAANRPEGKAGIVLIMGLSSAVRYLARPGGNGLEIIFHPKAKS